MSVCDVPAIEPEAAGGWSAEAAKGYFEFKLTDELEQFAVLYGVDALSDLCQRIQAEILSPRADEVE